MSVTQMADRFPLVLDNLFAKYFGSVSVDDCAQTEIACSAYGPVRGPSTTFQPRTGPYAEHAISDLSKSAFKMHTQVAAGALIFIFRQSSVVILDFRILPKGYS